MPAAAQAEVIRYKKKRELKRQADAVAAAQAEAQADATAAAHAAAANTMESSKPTGDGFRPDKRTTARHFGGLAVRIKKQVERGAKKSAAAHGAVAAAAGAAALWITNGVHVDVRLHPHYLLAASGAAVTPRFRTPPVVVAALVVGSGMATPGIGALSLDRLAAGGFRVYIGRAQPSRRVAGGGNAREAAEAADGMVQLAARQRWLLGYVCC